jgi:hypothetical protein
LDLKLLHQNTATSSYPFATQTTNELPDSAREKKRDEKNLQHLLSSTLESQNHSPKTDHSYLITTQNTQKNSMTQTQNSVPLKRYYNSSKTKTFLNLKIF